MRNALGTWKIMMDGNNKLIQWQHIVDLYEHQKSNGFTLANKLTKKHVMFQKNPMKVKYAVQVLSQSVANALLTMSELKHEKFVDVNATVQYLKTFDSIYDIMNSRNLREKCLKAPLQQENTHQWQTVFKDTASYICSLKTNTGKSVLESNRKASFLGIYILVKTKNSFLSFYHFRNKTVNLATKTNSNKCFYIQERTFLLSN